MQSGAVLATSITSFIGFLLNSTILALVLSRGRKLYHYLFSGFLFICAFWDLGVFLCMIRNSHVNELPIYGYIIWAPCTFMPAIIYHFTCNYLNQPSRKLTIFVWAACIVFFILGFSPMGGKMVGVYHYSWGNIFRPDATLLMGCLASAPFVYFFIWLSCWYLLRAYRRERSVLKKRHILYILISFFIVSLAMAKVSILYGIDNRYLMPICMFINDIAVALIGVAIIKYQLFDITVIIKKTTIYSVLAAIVIFVFSVSEHLLSTYVGQLLGEESMYIHIISIAAVVGVFMPVRGRLERAIERGFGRKKVKF